MKILIGVGILVLVVIASNAEINSIEGLSAFNYHRRFGIPEAARIKKIEKRTSDGGAVSRQRITSSSVTDIFGPTYQVGLIMQILLVYTSICSGSLISANRVMTAAHCQYDGLTYARTFTVVLGSKTIFSDGQRIDTTDVVMHPDYNWLNAENDIAVIRIPDVDFTDVIQPIALPSGYELSSNFEDSTALTSGFFSLTSEGDGSATQSFRSVSLSIISNDECANTFGWWVRDTNICISGDGGISACVGNSGSPLAITYDNNTILIGVASYSATAKCQAGLPIAYTRISSYVSWIQTI